MLAIHPYRPWWPQQTNTELTSRCANCADILSYVSQHVAAHTKSSATRYYHQRWVHDLDQKIAYTITTSTRFLICCSCVHQISQVTGSSGNPGSREDALDHAKVRQLRNNTSLPQQTQSKQSHAYKQAILSLSEIGSTVIAIYTYCDLINPWKRVHDNRALLHFCAQLFVNDQLSLALIILFRLVLHSVTMTQTQHNRLDTAVLQDTQSRHRPFRHQRHPI